MKAASDRMDTSTSHAVVCAGGLRTLEHREVVLHLSKEEFRHLVDVLILAPVLLTADPRVELALYEAIGLVRNRLGL